MSEFKKELATQIPERLIWNLLTESEIKFVKQRYLIIRLRQQNLSIRAIAKKLGVGTDTVVRVLKIAKKNRVLPPTSVTELKASSKWVFGQVRGEEE